MALTRRALLAGGAAGGALGLAGCLDLIDLQGTTDSSSHTVQAITAVTTDTTASECGTQEDETATADHRENTVVVEGTLLSPTPCYEATVMASLEETGLLVVVDVTADRADDDVCIQCQGAISYTSRIELATDTTVSEVVVDHKTGEQYSITAL